MAEEQREFGELQVVDREDVAKHLKISTRKLMQMESKGEFPKPRKLGRNVRWLGGDVNAWLIANLKLDLKK